MHFLQSTRRKKIVRKALISMIALGTISSSGLYALEPMTQTQTVLAATKTKAKASKAKKASTSSSSAKQWGGFKFYTAKEGRKQLKYYLVDQEPRGRQHGSNRGYPVGQGAFHPYKLNGTDGINYKFYPKTNHVYKSNAPGMYYPNAAIMHTADLKEKAVKLDMQVTLRYINMRNIPGSKVRPYIVFHANNHHISHGGEGKAVYEVTFFKHGTSTPYRIPGNYPIAFWDIDYGQSFRVNDSKHIMGVATSGGNSVTHYYVKPGSGEDSTTLYGFGNPHHWHNPDPRGTVLDTDWYGGMTWIESSNYGPLTTYSSGTNGTSSSVKTPTIQSIYTKSSKGSVGGSAGTGFSPGNMFDINFSTFSNPPELGKSDYGKDVSKTYSTSNKDWKPKLDGIKYDPKHPEKTKFWYRLWALSTYPSMAGAQPDKRSVAYAIKNFEIQDQKIDPGLDIDTSVKTGPGVGAKGFKLMYADDKNGSVDKAEMKNLPSATASLFKISTKNHRVSVTLKKKPTVKDALKKPYKDLFNRRIYVVFRVKGNKKLASEFKKKDKKGKVWTLNLKNVGMLKTDGGGGKKTATVVITTTVDPKSENSNKQSSYKYVFTMKDGEVPDKNSSNDSKYDFDIHDDDNERTVHSGQYLTYFVRFNVKPSQTKGPDKYVRIKEMKLSDKLDSHIKEANNIYISDHAGGKDIFSKSIGKN